MIAVLEGQLNLCLTHEVFKQSKSELGSKDIS